jgi:hypothetical protein
MTITDSLQITIWGGSAGGGSITNQLIFNGGEQNPPFRAAILGIVLSLTIPTEKSLMPSVSNRVSLVANLQEPEHLEQPVHGSVGSF